MARSSYAYVVLHDGLTDTMPVAAFTVKYELVSWLHSYTGSLNRIRVFRCPDSPFPVTSEFYKCPAQIPLSELI